MSSGLGSKTYGVNRTNLVGGALKPGVLAHDVKLETCAMQNSSYIAERLGAVMDIAKSTYDCSAEHIGEDPALALVVLKGLLSALSLSIIGTTNTDIGTVHRIYMSGTGATARCYLWADWAHTKGRQHIHTDNAVRLSSAS